MKKNTRIEEIYGKQSDTDNVFTAKARLLQSIFRVKSGYAMGKGPNENSEIEYGNMLLNGSSSPENFFSAETFEYAKKRIREKKKDETIGEYRLFNNLLSSMPMAFNLFHPLMMIKEKYPEQLNQMIRDLFPELPITHVDDIMIEFIPLPIEDYTNDRSAMDATIFFSDQVGYRYIIAIEVKYTDSLGSNTAKNNDLEKITAPDSDLFTEEGIAHIKKGCTQIYRNFRLTEKYRLVHQLKDSYSIVLAPKDHPSTDSEIKSLHEFLKSEYKYKLEKYALEAFVLALRKNCPEEFQPWLNWFFDRYLDFDKVKAIMNELNS